MDGLADYCTAGFADGRYPFAHEYHASFLEMTSHTSLVMMKIDNNGTPCGSDHT